MAKLAEPLIGVSNTGKVPNQKVAKSRIFLVLVLDKSFVLVDTTLKITQTNCIYL